MSSRLRSLNSTKINFFAFQDIIVCVSGILILVTLILATELDRPTSQTTYDADPELERQLSETLRQQAEADAQNQNLQELLAAAETAPAAEKLEVDIARLRAQLAEERKKHASLAEQLAASQSAIEARDRTLGLTDLKAQIQRVLQEVESLAKQEAEVRKEMATIEQKVTGVQSKLLKLAEREGKLWLIPDKSSTTKEPILAVISSSGAKVERFDHPDQAKEFNRTGVRSGFEAYLTQAKPVDQYFVFLVRPSGIELFDSLVKMARDRGFEVGFDALEEDKDVYFSTPPVPDETTPPPRSTAAQFQPGSGGYSDPKGGGAEVTGSGSVPGQKPSTASKEDPSRHRTVTASSVSTETGKQTPATPQPIAHSAANDRTLWQRILEWLGFSGSKGSSGQTGSSDAPTNGTRGVQISAVPADAVGHGPPSASSGTTGGGNVAEDDGKGSGGRSTGSGTGLSAASGTAKDASSQAEGSVDSTAGNASGSGVGNKKGNTPGDTGTNGESRTISKRAAGSVGQADTNSSTFTDAKKKPSPPTTQSKPPPPPKTKGWWQRFLEWLGLR